MKSKGRIGPDCINSILYFIKMFSNEMPINEIKQTHD